MNVDLKTRDDFINALTEKPSYNESIEDNFVFFFF